MESPRIAARPAQSRLSALRGKVLCLLLFILTFLSLSGLILLFCKPLGLSLHALSNWHLWGGVTCLPLVAWYLIRHYQRVKNLRKMIEFKLGVLSALSFLGLYISGVLLAPNWLAEQSGAWRLAHTVIGCAFIALLTSHLVLVISSAAKLRGRTIFRLIAQPVLLPLILALILSAWLMA